MYVYTHLSTCSAPAQSASHTYIYSSIYLSIDVYMYTQIYLHARTFAESDLADGVYFLYININKYI